MDSTPCLLSPLRANSSGRFEKLPCVVEHRRVVQSHGGDDNGLGVLAPRQKNSAEGLVGKSILRAELLARRDG